MKPKKLTPAQRKTIRQDAVDRRARFIRRQFELYTALDRLSVYLNLNIAGVEECEVIMDNPDWRKKLEKAQKQMSSLYQEIGQAFWAITEEIEKGTLNILP